MVEALICTQNWLTSTHVALNETPTIEDMEFCEQVERGIYVFYSFYLFELFTKFDCLLLPLK